MPMRTLLLFTTFGLVAASAAGEQIDAQTSDARTPWTSLAANDAAEDFHFVIVSDRTGGARPGIFESALPKADLLEPAFVVSIGDLIEGYTEDQAQIDAEWDEFEGFVEQLTVPFFYVAGNHDMNNAVMAEAWRERFGPSYYHFVYKDVLFLVLNSELFGMVSKPDTPVPGPWTQAEQLAFVERTLERYPAPRWTIVLVHQPLWDYAGGPRGDWPEVERMLGRQGLHGVRRPLPPLREARAQRPPLHHLGDHGRWQQPARRALWRVRPCRLGDDDRLGSTHRQPHARRHP